MTAENEWIDHDWRYVPFSAVDTETTGVNEDDKIVELAIVHCQYGGAPVIAFSSLINPGRPIPVEATAVHGITDEMVKDAPTIEDVAIDVIRALTMASASPMALLPPIVGYNLYHFDDPLLAREVPGYADLTNPKIDPIVVVRSRHVGKFWKSGGGKDYDFDRLEDAINELREDLRELSLAVRAPISDYAQPLLDQRPSAKPGGRHSLAAVCERYGLGGPQKGFEAEFHRAAWDALLAGRVTLQLAEFMSADARKCEQRLRAEAIRQEAERAAFFTKLRNQETARQQSRTRVYAIKIAELEAEIRSLRAMQAAQ